MMKKAIRPADLFWGFVGVGIGFPSLCTPVAKRIAMGRGNARIAKWRKSASRQQDGGRA